jgi:DNA polymerase elongation subunit (family B)
MKTLILDIETSPNVAHVWGLYNQNIGINQLLEPSFVMCWSAKWLHDKKIMFSSVYHNTPKKMIKEIHSLVDEADAVVTYNGKKFDMPTLNKEFLKHNLKPPSPYKDIDLYLTVKSKFNFPSKKLDYVARQLKVGKKTSHSGHELWLKCLTNDKQAWNTMKKYNMNDVIITEEVYNKIIGWINNHPNHNQFTRDEVCPNCGGLHLIKRGLTCNSVNVYQRLYCKDCGKWSRKNKAIKELKKHDSIVPV